MGGTPTPLNVGSPDEFPVDRLKQNGACLYWTTPPQDWNLFHQVIAAPKVGGEPVVVLQGDHSDGLHFAVDASGVYSVDEYSGKVMKATK